MTGERASLALGHPPDDLSDFPNAYVEGERYRAHHADNGPWWFASAPEAPSQGGRFDLSAPNGTCYVANDVEVAVRERLGTRAAGYRWLPADMLDDAEVSRMECADRPFPGLLADTMNRGASGTVTREVATTVDYQLTQEWAEAWARDGFAGVRYEPRFTVGEHLFAEAWFGPAGAFAAGRATTADGWRDGLPIARDVAVDRATVLD